MTTYLSALAILAVSVLGGCALARLGGEEPGWRHSALGFAAAIVTASIGVRLPGHGTTAIVLLVVLTLAGVATRPKPRPDALLMAALTGGAALVVASLPYIVAGRIGPPGIGVDEDLSFHLVWADALARSGDAAGLIFKGYPVGGDSLAGAIGEIWHGEPSMLGLMLAIPVLTAWTAVAGLRDVAPRLRVIAAVLTGVPYLAAAYLAESSFKEPLGGLVLLAFALTLRDLAQGRVKPRGAIVGSLVLAAAAVANWTVAGLIWIVATAVAFALAEIVLGNHENLPKLNRRLILRGGAGLVVLGLLGVLVAASSGFFTRGPGSFAFGGGHGPGGNFLGQISRVEVLGVWPSFDFRVDPVNVSGLIWHGGVALAVILGVAGLAHALSRRDFALPAALLTGAAVYIVGDTTALPYISAKGLVILAPAAMLLTLGALARLAPRALPARVVWTGVAAAFVVLAGASSMLALRGAQVRDPAQADDLAAIGKLTRGHDSVYIGRDSYAAWDLLGTPVGVYNTYSGSPFLPLTARPPKPNGTGTLDLDSIEVSLLNQVRYVIARRTLFSSQPDPHLHRVAATRWYALYERRGRISEHSVLNERDDPGAPFSCAGLGRAFVRAGALAVVRPAPVIAPAAGWRGQVGETPNQVRAAAAVAPGAILHQGMQLPRGRWELSISYSSPVRLRVRAGSLDTRMPAQSADLSAVWRVGEIDSTGAPVDVRLELDPLRRFQADGPPALIGRVAAAPVGKPARLVPAAKACGRYVDWLRPGR